MQISQPLISYNTNHNRKHTHKKINIISSSRNNNLDTSSPFKQMSKSVISKKYVYTKPQFSINSKEMSQANSLFHQNNTNSLAISKQSTQDHIANYSNNNKRKVIQFSMHVARLSGKTHIPSKPPTKSIISNIQIGKPIISENYSNKLTSILNDKVNNTFGIIIRFKIKIH